MLQNDPKYAAMIIEAIQVSADYLPKFGLVPFPCIYDRYKK